MAIIVSVLTVVLLSAISTSVGEERSLLNGQKQELVESLKEFESLLKTDGEPDPLIVEVLNEDLSDPVLAGIKADYLDFYNNVKDTGEVAYSKADFSPMVSARLSGMFQQNENVGGFKAKRGSFGHVVSLQDSKLGHICSGFIFDKYHIVTAAHCCSRPNPDSYFSVQAGGLVTQDLNAEYVQKRNVTKLFRHPDFDSYNFNNDICMVQVIEPFQFNTYIQQGVTPNNKQEYSDGAGVTVVGYGNFEVDDPLYYKHLRVVSDIDCATRHEFHLAITPSMICATGHQFNGYGCLGDSGAPLVSKNNPKEIIGIASWSEKCGVSNTPSGFTQVSYHTRWMREVILGSQDEFAIPGQSKGLPPFRRTSLAEMAKYYASIRQMANRYPAEYVRSTIQETAEEMEAVAKKYESNAQDNWDQLKEISKEYRTLNGGIPISPNQPKLVVYPSHYKPGTIPFHFPYPVKYVATSPVAPRLMINPIPVGYPQYPFAPHLRQI